MDFDFFNSPSHPKKKKMKRILFILVCISINLTLFSHPWKPSHYVIIDTDGGIDDMKAITMLLASPDVRVLAITVSPGTLNTGSAYKKVRSLLNSFYHEGIPVGVNRISEFKSPDFQVALNTSWGDENGLDEKNAPDAISLISEILSTGSTKLSFICLGGVSTVSEAIRTLPVFKQEVKEIIWSSEGPDNNDGFNFNINKSESNRLLKGDIPVRIVKGTGDEIFYNDNLLSRISGITTVYGEKVSGFLNSDIAKNHPYSKEGKDEMVVLYLHYPDLFSTVKSEKNSICTPGNIDSLRTKSIQILAGLTVAKNQVIKEFPSDPSFYFTDIEPFVRDIINRYGMDEWVSGVIASELHRHLGAFTVIGVKMGIRAREYYDTGVDEFSLISYAGSSTPLSCINDGLQVSTGATPGHGLLSVDNDPPTSPSAEFTYMNRKIKLTLKPELSRKISDELKQINFVYGLDSNIYWELVRKNSIKYWLDLDRHDIFIIEEIH
jgi:pyrimidine-specific ribonucleoside hydrolase